MFLNTYKIHRTHFCSSLQNTSYFLTPKTRNEKKKDTILGASIASLDNIVFGLCRCVTPCVILCTFACIWKISKCKATHRHREQSLTWMSLISPLQVPLHDLLAGRAGHWSGRSAQGSLHLCAVLLRANGNHRSLICGVSVCRSAQRCLL